MSPDTISKKKAVTIDELSITQVQRLSERLGKRLSRMTDRLIVKANQMLNAYGLEAKIQVFIVKKELPQD